MIYALFIFVQFVASTVLSIQQVDNKCWLNGDYLHLIKLSFPFPSPLIFQNARYGETLSTFSEEQNIGGTTFCFQCK
jgi:hypothetical protein